MQLHIFQCATPTTSQVRDKVQKVIPSWALDNYTIIRNILLLHNRGEMIDVDMTYNKGKFWEGFDSRPKHKFDLHPQLEEVIEADCGSLPLENKSVNSVMLDLPFLVDKYNTSALMAQKFSKFCSIEELLDTNRRGICEGYRILKRGGGNDS